MQSVISPLPSSDGAGVRVRAAARLALILALGAGLPARQLQASERAEVSLTCPLDGTVFTAVQDLSGYASGQRLDLMKVGPISQPWSLARCPTCGYPLYDKHPSAEDIIRLRAAVSGERFRTEGRDGTPYFALGVLLEELRAPAFEVAWAYLQASWEVEDAGAAEYARVADRARDWFDRAATEWRASAPHQREWCIARYLPVELYRRTGQFTEARRRLDAISTLQNESLPWLPAALAAQDSLITQRDARPDTGRTDLPAPPPVPRTNP